MPHPKEPMTNYLTAKAKHQENISVHRKTYIFEWKTSTKSWSSDTLFTTIYQFETRYIFIKTRRKSFNLLEVTEIHR